MSDAAYFELLQLANIKLTDEEIDRRDFKAESRVILKEFDKSAKKGDADRLQFVIAHPKMHKMWACLYGENYCVINKMICGNYIMTARELICQGVNLNSIVNDLSLLELVAGGRPEMYQSPMIALLLERKCDVNVTGTSEDTALTVAVKNDNVTIVMQLLEAKADINKYSPLKWCFDRSFARRAHWRNITPACQQIGFELMHRGADFVGVLDRPNYYTGIFGIETIRGPFAEYIHTVYSEQVFVILSPFFGKTQCKELGDLIAGYLSLYAI
ncbi:MAG: hypothetical protein Faunusvirus42_6 [Faunusvirus sp.]|jgi:hypothetical protein|uniref:Uncharacterized protein n=1 Tax=Faunusvirus sp. TaxID=2487766 RepID=A0A3G5A0E0_9VIRU|nr:MAG: hypothetical protein Faunusvirus42_6 [Faunusvirus sp.]